MIKFKDKSHETLSLAHEESPSQLQNHASSFDLFPPITSSCKGLRLLYGFNNNQFLENEDENLFADK